ncbi:MAG: hypothetical protein QOF25_1918, partial [Mycobacterium sp.]|nr:hypothetical protein [Mycobacterium sp.]
MRVWLRRNHLRVSVAVGLVGVLLAGCSSGPAPAPASTTRPPAEAGLEEVTVQVPDDFAARPFDEPRKALVPRGWTLSVWARIPQPRLAAWTPDGNLLVSVPSTGQVIRLQPTGPGALDNLLLEGLDQPHGLAFAGATLYVAESDQVDAYDYANGTVSNGRTVAAGL